MTIHLVRAVASRLKRPTRTSVQDRTSRMRHVSLHGLAPDGVCHAQPVASLAVRSYRTFSPLPACAPWGGQAVCFSAALSLGSPPPGVTRHPDPVEPGLSSPTGFLRWRHPRSSSHLTALRDELSNLPVRAAMMYAATQSTISRQGSKVWSRLGVLALQCLGTFGDLKPLGVPFQVHRTSLPARRVNYQPLRPV